MPATYARPSTPSDDEDDVLTRDREQVVETRRLEGVAEVRVDALVGAEHDCRRRAPPLARRPAREGVRDRRAQPVADAADPAPPADDAPRPARVQHDVDAPPREPAPLVETGLGPSRGDRARSQLENGALGRCPSRRKLEQDALAQERPGEAAHFAHQRVRRIASRGRARDNDLRPLDLADAPGEDAVVERVDPQRAPPEAQRSETDAEEALRADDPGARTATTAHPR